MYWLSIPGHSVRQEKRIKQKSRQSNYEGKNLRKWTVRVIETQFLSILRKLEFRFSDPTKCLKDSTFEITLSSQE